MDGMEIQEIRDLCKNVAREIKEWREESRINIIYFTESLKKLQGTLTQEDYDKEKEYGVSSGEEGKNAKQMEQHEENDGRKIVLQTGHFQNGHVKGNALDNLDERDEEGKGALKLNELEKGLIKEGIGEGEDGHTFDNDYKLSTKISTDDLILGCGQNEKGYERETKKFRKTAFLKRKRKKKKKKSRDDKHLGWQASKDWQEGRQFEEW